MANSDGHFEVAGLDNGLYYVTAFSPAYVAPPRDIDTPAPVYRVGDSLRLELLRGGVITGTLTNASGEPMIGVRIRALMVRQTNKRSRVGVW